MKALIVLSAAAALVVATPAFANPDWTLESPIKVTPASVPADVEGTIVRMVGGASSGPRTAAPAADPCACGQKAPSRRLERRRSRPT
jgi:hypothetical protein